MSPAIHVWGGRSILIPLRLTTTLRMEKKTKIVEQLPLFVIPHEIQAIIVQYAGVAFSALVPFLPQTYFTDWDIVICLRDTMREDEKRMDEYLNAFSEITSTRRANKHFMIRGGGRDNGRWIGQFTQIEYVFFLSTYMETSHILSLLINRERRNDENSLSSHVLDQLTEELLSAPDWAERAREIIGDVLHRYNEQNYIEFTEEVLLRNPEDIKKEHYRDYAKKLVLFGGEYRSYFSIYNEEKYWPSLAEAIPCEERALPVMKEMGITLTEETLVRINNVYLLDTRRLNEDFDYFVRILTLCLERHGETDDDACYGLFLSFRNGSCGLVYEYIISTSLPIHMRRGGPVTAEQRRTMSSILPCSGMTYQMNIDLCTFFGIDLYQYIVNFLKKCHENQDLSPDDECSDLISSCIDFLDKTWTEKQGGDSKWREKIKEERRHVNQSHHEGERSYYENGPLPRSPCGAVIIEGNRDDAKNTSRRKYEVITKRGGRSGGRNTRRTGRRNGGRRRKEVSPCDKFVSSLLECCTYLPIVSLLHNCKAFVDYVTWRYTAFSSLSPIEARKHVSLICQNNLCRCHWDDRKVNPKACRTRLFITTEFGCDLTVDQFTRRIEKYKRKDESLVDMLIDLQSSHAFDHVYNDTFVDESGYEHKNIISLFPKEDAPQCRQRDVLIEEIDTDEYIIPAVNVERMHYGGSLDNGRFKNNPALVRAIRRAFNNIEVNRNFSKDAVIVLTKMIYPGKGK